MITVKIISSGNPKYDSNGVQLPPDIVINEKIRKLEDAGAKNLTIDKVNSVAGMMDVVVHYESKGMKPVDIDDKPEIKAPAPEVKLADDEIDAVEKECERADGLFKTAPGRDTILCPYGDQTAPEVSESGTVRYYDPIKKSFVK